MINISKPQDQLRQNRTLLLIIGGVSSVSGLLIWSSSPFIWSSTKNHTNIVLRYFALLTGLTAGVTAIVCGNQLQKINPLVKAIETAERNDFLEQLAVSQFQQQQRWHQMAIAPTQLQPVDVAVHSEPSDQGSATSTDQLPTSTNSEVNGSEHFRSLWKSVSLLKEQGISDTKIIEEVLGMSGRKFNEGKQMLDALLQLGEQQGW